METISYESQEGQVGYRGIILADGDVFKSFMTADVASRLRDEEGEKEFEAHLRGLASTGFANNRLNDILSAAVPEERDWAVGEAMAEAWLMRRHNVVWPWNMERDKRTPKASLPGADLVGFEINNNQVRFVFGEVKTSSDTNTPPNVMNGRSGMEHQIDNLANNLIVINQLLKWLLHRCKRTEHEASFNSATISFLDPGNIALFGVLIRDTEPNELDLQARGRRLGEKLAAPTTCQLIALYIPCTIPNLPAQVAGGES